MYQIVLAYCSCNHVLINFVGVGRYGGLVDERTIWLAAPRFRSTSRWYVGHFSSRSPCTMNRRVLDPLILWKFSMSPRWRSESSSRDILVKQLSKKDVCIEAIGLLPALKLNYRRVSVLADASVLCSSRSRILYTRCNLHLVYNAFLPIEWR
jgi:hypothetical protein